MKILILDTYAILHRAFHALPPLTTPEGEPINAVYGFASILLRMRRELKPDYIVAARDLAGKTVRHEAYREYKAQRPETPADLESQFAKLDILLKAFGIPLLSAPGFEADDVIGAITQKLAARGDAEIVIVTGDADMLQLAGPSVMVMAMKKGISEFVLYDPAAVRERFGFAPEALPDYKGLRGDPSDNIPGVKGIGDKTASALIQKFGTLEDIYAALKGGEGAISKSVAEKLQQGRDKAFLSRQLATIRKDAPVDLDVLSSAPENAEGDAGVRDLFQKWGFTSLLKRLSAVSVPDAAQQNSANAGRTPPLWEASAPASNSAILNLNTAERMCGFLEAGRGKEIGLIGDGATLFLIRVDDNAIAECDPALFRNARHSDAEACAGRLLRESSVVAYDTKALARLLLARGAMPERVGFDLMLAAYLLAAGDRDFSYTRIVRTALRRSDDLVFRDALGHFFSVRHILEAGIADQNLGRVLHEIEIPLAPALARMEAAGISIDAAFLEKLSGELSGKIGAVTAEIYALAGEEFNINSPAQLGRILFERLGLSRVGVRRTPKGGAVSTRASELEKLAGVHPIIEKLLQYREWSKLKSTYVDALPRLIAADGRLHTTFVQTGTATGRLSSVNPNLQNIPILGAVGREVRRAFFAPPGWSIVSCDYSQVELRVAAHLARDEKMIAAFRRGTDIHRLTASEVFNVPFEAVTGEQRRAAKTLNFGILYGMGPNALAQSTGMGRDEAERFIEEYFHDFSGVRAFLDKTKQSAYEKGYVETISGRRRRIPELFSSNGRARSEAERMAINTPIQGSATGDIIKIAMIRVDNWIRQRGIDDVRLLLQVHDELVFEVQDDVVAAVIPEIRRTMEGAMELVVPLVVDVKIGKNWGELETMKYGI
ncbi:MAG: DNA polymerase I [Patescibacteria group bacterium]